MTQDAGILLTFLTSNLFFPSFSSSLLFEVAGGSTSITSAMLIEAVEARNGSCGKDKLAQAVAPSVNCHDLPFAGS
jgi:hypothetical protein